MSLDDKIQVPPLDLGPAVRSIGGEPATVQRGETFEGGGMVSVRGARQGRGWRDGEYVGKAADGSTRSAAEAKAQKDSLTAPPEPVFSGVGSDNASHLIDAVEIVVNQNGTPKFMMILGSTPYSMP